jgi:hypothetical protein
LSLGTAKPAGHDRSKAKSSARGRRGCVNHYHDAWFWRAMVETREARHVTGRVWIGGVPGKPPRVGLARRVVLPLLRMAGLAEKPVEAHSVERKEVAVRESCPCGGDDEFEDREPVLHDGEWALRCTECGHLDRLRWLSDEARPLVVGLARRRWRLRLRREVRS